MKHIAVAAAAMAAMSAAAPVQAETRIVEIGTFTAIDIASGIEATVTVGPAQAIEIEAGDAGLVDKVQVRVEGNTLKAWIDWSILDLFGAPQREIHMRISVPAVTSLEASSGATVAATGVAGDDLRLEASSGASLTALGVVGARLDIESSSGAGVTVSGTCTSADADASSGAGIEAGDLPCADVHADASSGAHMTVSASNSINADASSGGHITVRGNPPTRNVDEDSGGNVD